MRSRRDTAPTAGESPPGPRGDPFIRAEREMHRGSPEGPEPVGGGGLEDRRSVGEGGQGEDQPVWTEGMQRLSGLGDRKDEILCRPSHRAQGLLSHSHSLVYFLGFSFLQLGVILVSPFSGLASHLNNQKLMGMGSLSRKKNK